jgi:hypothetical protein
MSDTPATPSQMKVGVRVKCIYRFPGNIDVDRTGKTGTVVSVFGGPLSFQYTIKWDDGSTGDPHWGEASSFTILPNQNSQIEIDEVEVPTQALPETTATTTTNPPFDFDAYNRGDMIKREKKDKAR